jgi:hypothetical protein
MRKIFLGIMTTGLVLSIPHLANANDAYSRFIKTQVAEFEGDKAPENCREKKLEEKDENNNKITYELCAVKGKPIYIRASNDGSPFGVMNYNKGKLVGLSIAEGTAGVGFRNEQPVVYWNSGEFGTRSVNWNLSAKDKATHRKEVDKSNRLLKKFGIR